MSMDFTIKRWIWFDGESPLKAFCDVAINNQLVIKGVRVVDGRHGLFVSMPRQQGKEGRWYDSVVPLSPEVKAQLSELVLEAYQAHRARQTCSSAIGDKP